MTARNDKPLMKKHQAVPTVTNSIPPSAGPMTRAPLNIIELRAMALGRSSRPTISTTNDWRAGPSKALTRPRSAASITISHTCTIPANVSTARMKASTMAEACVTTIRLRLLTRSTTTPAHGETSSAGIAAANPTMPSINSEWLSS
jgi:hypothetical protein